MTTELIKQGTWVDFEYNGITGTWVDFEYNGITGTGKVVGMSSQLPVVGPIYIIDTEKVISDEYPYTHFVCPSCYINEIFEDNTILGIKNFSGQTVEEVASLVLGKKYKTTMDDFFEDLFRGKLESDREFYLNVVLLFAERNPNMFVEKSGGNVGDEISNENSK